MDEDSVSDPEGAVEPTLKALIVRCLLVYGVTVVLCVLVPLLS